MVTTPRLPAVVRGRVRHQRVTPIRHSLSFRTHLWLLDLDQPLPDHALASFPARDHFGGTAGSVREAAIAFAASRGESVQPGERLLMLAAARSLGYVFNPLSVFACVDGQGRMRWAILEIHNTYGARHAHLVRPDAEGRFTIAKEFYVSPFFEIEGEYQGRVRLEQDGIEVDIDLVQRGERPFSATFAGTPKPANAFRLAAAALRTPLSTYQTTVRIHIHGIWLWMRRLPVVPRPTHEMQAGMR